MDFHTQKPLGKDARSASIGNRQKSRLRRINTEYKYKIQRDFDCPSARRSIAPRTDGEPRDDDNPGPAYYEPKRPHSARTHGLGPKDGKRFEPSWIPKSDTPAPCTYTIKEPASGPSFTLHEGHEGIGGSTIGPGPKYNPDNDRCGKRSPRFSIRPRTGVEQKSATQDVGYRVLPPNSVPPIYIHRRENLDLIPE